MPSAIPPQVPSATPSQDKLGFQGEGFDWNEYIKYRPAYPPSFYQRLYDEHAKNLNTFGIVNDVGAGAGIASEKLAEKFAKVIVSEPNDKYVKIAEHRLTSLGRFSKSQFSFLREGAEKSSLLDNSLDCLTICEALHWSDMQTSINEFARCLKPGGTLGIFHYSTPHFEDKDVNEAWANWMGCAVIRFGDSEIYTRAFQNLRNAYRNIYFDPKIWTEGVSRIYCNMEGDVNMMRMGLPRGAGAEFVREMTKVEVPNRAGKTDKIEWIEDDQEWFDEVDFEYMRNMYRNMVPGKSEETGSMQAMEKLKNAMGGKKHKIRYPAFQIIATKC